MNIYHVSMWLLVGLVFGEFNMLLNIYLTNFNKKINCMYPVHKRKLRNWPLIMYNTLTALLGFFMAGICVGKFIIALSKNCDKVIKRIVKRKATRRARDNDRARHEARRIYGDTI
jgi:hypothetical protein